MELLELVQGAGRRRYEARITEAFCALLRQNGFSYRQIGYLSGRNYETVRYHVTRHRTDIKNDASYRAVFFFMRDSIADASI